MTRMVAVVFATLALLLGGTLWLRDAVEARRDTARAVLEQAADVDLAEAARQAAEAGLDLILEYLPPEGETEPARARRPVVAARSSVNLPTSERRPAAPPARTTAPEPAVAQVEIEEAAIADPRPLPFFESGRPADEAVLLGEDSLDANVDSLPSVASAPEEPQRRVRLIRRLLSVYELLGDAQ